MKRVRPLLILVSLISVLISSGCSDTVKRRPDGSGESAESRRTIRLFNGKNFDGFYTYLTESGRNHDPLDVFTVRDGVIRVSGQEWGYLMTNDEYENYHLIVEYKWGEQTWPPREHAARDSGIILHSIGEDAAYSDVWMRGIEAQIIEGGTGDFIVVGDGTDRFTITSPVHGPGTDRPQAYKPGGEPLRLEGSGRIFWYGRDPAWEDVKGFRGPDDVEHPVGEWNRMECIAVGDEITLKLNGVVVNHGYDVRPRKGRIQFQSESAVVFFRRIDLIPLDPDDVSRTTESRSAPPGGGE